MSRENGSVIGVDNTPTTSAASGVWSMNAVARAVKESIWPVSVPPVLTLDFDETTTLDSRITFTRATNGTYFDSSGVLQTASSGVARFDHRLESSVWVNKGLLIEEQRTNLQVYSQEFDNADWTKSGSSITANTIVAPDGALTGDKLVEDTSNGEHRIFSGNISWAGNTQYTFTFYLKAAERFRCDILFGTAGNWVNGDAARVVSLNLTAGTITTSPTSPGAASIESVGNGWFRCRITATTVASPSPSGVFLRIADSNGSASYTGDGYSGIYLWGAQVEAGAFPTSYIATTSASATRNADQASMTSTNFSDWYNATENTIFSQFNYLGDITNYTDAPRVYSISNNTNNERIQLAAINTPIINLFISTGGSEQASFSSTPSPTTPNTTYKHAVVFKVNDFAASLDGQTVTTDTNGTLPTVDRMYIGASAVNGAAAFLNGHLAKFYYWNIRKSDAFLQNITG